MNDGMELKKDCNRAMEEMNYAEAIIKYTVGLNSIN